MHLPRGLPLLVYALYRRDVVFCRPGVWPVRSSAQSVFRWFDAARASPLLAIVVVLSIFERKKKCGPTGSLSEIPIRCFGSGRERHFVQERYIHIRYAMKHPAGLACGIFRQALPEIVFQIRK